MGHSRGFFHVRAMSALGEERTLEYITGTITRDWVWFCALIDRSGTKSYPSKKIQASNESPSRIRPGLSREDPPSTKRYGPRPS